MPENDLLEQLYRPNAVSTRFQPVCRLDEQGWSAVAYEALTRGPRDTNLEKPDILFEYVRRKHRIAGIDRLCITAALESSRRIAEPRPVMVNLHGWTLTFDDDFVVLAEAVCDAFGIPRANVVFEIIENALPSRDRRFFRRLESLQASGFRIALDDVGCGSANLDVVVDGPFDILKIGRPLLIDLARSPRRQAMAEMLLALGERLGVDVYAEGIETPADLDAAARLGFRFVQGFVFQPPVHPEELQTHFSTPGSQTW